MKHEIVLSPQARAQFHGLSAYDRAKVRDAIDTHLQHHPTAESKSRIKRLRGLRQPQYRMRVDDMRVFYDVNDESNRVEVLGFVNKSDTPEWLNLHGVPE